MTASAKLRLTIEAAKTAYEQETGAVITDIRVKCYRVELAQGTHTAVQSVEVEALAQMGEAQG